MFANGVHVFNDVQSRLVEQVKTLKRLSGHVESSFDKPAEILSTKVQKFSLKIRK